MTDGDVAVNVWIETGTWYIFFFWNWGRFITLDIYWNLLIRTFAEFINPDHYWNFHFLSSLTATSKTECRGISGCNWAKVFHGKSRSQVIAVHSLHLDPRASAMESNSIKTNKTYKTNNIFMSYSYTKQTYTTGTKTDVASESRDPSQPRWESPSLPFTIAFEGPQNQVNFKK